MNYAEFFKQKVRPLMIESIAASMAKIVSSAQGIGITKEKLLEQISYTWDEATTLSQVDLAELSLDALIDEAHLFQKIMEVTKESLE